MREKNQNIELLRAIACVMVIVIHVTNYFNRAYDSISNGEYVFSVILNALSRVCVPCFFMISGALLVSRQETFKKNLKRAFHMLIVLIIWSIIYYFFNEYFMHTPVALNKIMDVPAEAHMWYLYTLIPIYLFLPFVQLICGEMTSKVEKIIFYVWMTLIVASTIATTIGKLYGVGIRLYVGADEWFFLFAGYFLMKYREKIPGKSQMWLIFSVISSLLNAALTCVFSYERNQYEGFFFKYRTALIMISAICLFAWALKKENVKVSKYVTSFCACSFGIYLIHIIFLDVFKKYVQPQDINAYIIVPILVVVIGLLSWGSIWLLHKTKVGKKIS